MTQPIARSDIRQIQEIIDDPRSEPSTVEWAERLLPQVTAWVELKESWAKRDQPKGK